MTRMRAMILAAGRGERLRPLTDRVPKPLLEVAGTPIIVGIIERLRDADITTLVINLGWLGDQVRDRLGSGKAYGVSIKYSDEGDAPLETAGGIVKALPLLGRKPFWVVNSDVVTDYPFPERTLEGIDLAHLVMVDNPPYARRGDFALERGRLHIAGERRLTYSGIGVYHPKFFAGERAVRKPLLPLLQRAIVAGRVSGEYYHGHWTDVGTVERLREASLK